MVFTLRRLPAVSDEDFERDAKAVAADLARPRAACPPRGPSALYRHFAGKQDVLATVLAGGLDSAATWSPAWTRPTGPPPRPGWPPTPSTSAT